MARSPQDLSVLWKKTVEHTLLPLAVGARLLQDSESEECGQEGPDEPPSRGCLLERPLNKVPLLSQASPAIGSSSILHLEPTLSPGHRQGTGTRKEGDGHQAVGSLSDGGRCRP